MGTTLAKLALKDAINELVVKVHLTGHEALAAAHQVWQAVEQNLAVEVVIDDPALRELFSHVLAVEEMLRRVRSQAQSILKVGQAIVPPHGVAAKLRELQDAALEAGGETPGAEILQEDLEDASQAVVEATERLRKRLNSDVFAVVEDRFRIHSVLREDLREGLRWRAVADRKRRDLVSNSRAISLSGLNSAGMNDGDALLREATAHVVAIEEKVLSRLLKLKAESVEAVQAPWRALLQIQAEFFMSQAAVWSPVTGSFVECGVLRDRHAITAI